MQRVGILGGTFDPIHYGHLAIAEEVACALELAHIYMVPAAQQPLKPARHLATPQQRLDMVRLACEDNPRLIPSDLELRRTPPSFTVDTLQEFRALLGSDTEMWFILGSDALADLPRWHAARELVALTSFAVVVRPGAAIDLARLEPVLPGLTARTAIIAGPRLDIASSDLRQRIAAGQPVRYQLPERVRRYILAQQLYLPRQPGDD